MQNKKNKKNKKQNGGSNEGSVIFTYVLLTFVIGFILYCVYWCTSSGPVNCDTFKNSLFRGDDNSLKKAWGYFLVPDSPLTTAGKIVANKVETVKKFVLGEK